MSKPSLKSGRFVLRTSPHLHFLLSERALNEGISLNEICNRLLVESLKQSSTEIVSEAIIHELVKIYEPLGLQAIILFGSHARGASTQSSDVDLLLVMGDQTSIQRRLYRYWDHEVINLHFVHFPRENTELSSLWLEVLLDGRCIYFKHEGFEHRFAALKQRLWDGTYQRKQSHGHAYWVKKGSKHEK